MSGKELVDTLHSITLRELRLNRVLNGHSVRNIAAEQTVLLEPFTGSSPRRGRFDFLVVTQEGTTVGFEVLARPTHGKMSKKLSYAKEVDEFVFVLPHDSFEWYRKRASLFKTLGKKHFFSREFSHPRLWVWLANSDTGKIEKKGVFSEVFHTH